MKHIVFFTGAGMSAESGIKTFRDANGLWEGHDIYEVASPEGFHNNPALVLDFYNKRRAQLLSVSPNSAHKTIAQLEDRYNVSIVTQNVDDLHERAGSNNVLHLHGELLKAQSTGNPNYITNGKPISTLGDHCPQGHQMRPFIVWFGEDVPLFDEAIDLVAQADIFVIVGTSLQVYPAAHLIHHCKPGTAMYYIDPNPTTIPKEFIHIKSNATMGMERFITSIVMP